MTRAKLPPGPGAVDRDAFVAAREITLDGFQRDALDALDDGSSVLVAAPTGSGKTVVAEYAIEAALAGGGKAFYTTPLKALSNQKFGDFVRRYGRTQVGLLTGDNSINGEAPIVVMTTEVLRNMIYAASPTLDSVSVVVLDEVHYLQDRYRGAVWEEVIIHVDRSVRLVCLSATVANAVEVAAWLETVRGPTVAVVETKRPVELSDLYLTGIRGSDLLELLPTFAGTGEHRRPNPEALRLDRTPPRGGGGGQARFRGRLRAPGRVETVELLDAQRMLPAIFFVFSRNGCDQAVEQGLGARLALTTGEERDELRRIAKAHTERLDDDDLAVLGYGRWLAGLEAGFAAHHAGVVPPMKEAVEEAFAAGLVKVVFATETLALGVNMPARTVVIEKLTKFTGERHEFLTAGEYTQLTGRAGRRGIDERGYAIVWWSPFVGFEQVASLANRGSEPLVSSFRPNYNMAVNLVHRYPREDAHRLLNLSFAQYRADRDVVVLERELERARARVASYRESAEAGDVPLATIRREAEAAQSSRQASRRATERALEALRPGDLVPMGRRSQNVVVVAREPRKGAVRWQVVDVHRVLRRIGIEDFDAAPEVVGHIDLPEPFAPNSPAFRRQVAERAQRVRRTASARAVDASARPGHSADPERESRLRAAAMADRAQREVTRLERRVGSRGNSVARQFDRVLGVLEAWGYVDGWELTEPGEILARLYSECDLLLAESIRDGLLDGLSPAELAAVASCFCYERRGSDADRAGPPVRWPTSKVAQRAREIERRWRTLADLEDDLGLPVTRPPDPGFTPVISDWVRGDTLADVLDDDVTAGDFVRQVKQCIDLLRQIADVASDPTTAATARRASEACLRGVVALANVVAG